MNECYVYFTLKIDVWKQVTFVGAVIHSFNHCQNRDWCWLEAQRKISKSQVYELHWNDDKFY